MNKKEILAKILDVDVKSINLHKSGTLRVDEALEAMEEYSQLQTSVEISQKTEIEISKVIQDIADGKVHPSTGSARLMIILKQPNNQVDALIETIKRMKDNSGREGCTYGDTKYDSLSVVYGYNEAIDDIVKTIQDLKQIKL